MALSQSEIKAILSLDSAGFQRDAAAAAASLNRLGTAAGATGQQMGGLKSGLAVGAGFAAVTTAVTLAVAAFGSAKGAVIDFNAQMQSAEGAFTGLLGSGQRARAFLGELQQFAATTPFEFPDVLKGAQRFLGMGVAAERVLPMMRDISTVVSAFGGTSESVNRVTVALSQMQARGRVAANDMNQLTEAGVPAWKMLADALNLPIAKVRELAEAGQISSDVMIEAIHKAANTPEMQAVAANMAKSWNAAFSNLQDGIRMFLAAGTRPLFDELTNVVGAIGTWLVTSEEAKVLQAALAAAVRGLVDGLKQLFAWAGMAGQALATLASAIPGIERLRSALGGLSGGGAVEGVAAGMTTAAASAARLNAQIDANRAALTELPKQAAALTGRLEENEASMKRNAQAIRENEGALRGVRAQAEEVKETYEAKAASVRDEIEGITGAQAALKAQIADIKAGYDAQTDALKGQQAAIEAQQQAVKRQADDIKTAYEGLAEPIEAALRTTNDQLRDNKDAADDVKAAYAAQIEPLERSLETIRRQIDLQRQQEDLANRIKSAELARAKVAAIGDPVERARVAAQLDALDAQKDSLELEKRAAEIRKRLKDDKDVSPQEREILRIDQERIALQQRLAGMTDQQRLAEIKVAQATLDAAKDQQEIQRAREDMAIAQQAAAINGIKAEEKARLDALGRQRTELERQADDQREMLDALKTSMEAALAPLEARGKALARQHEDVANAIKGVELAEQAALKPLEARGRELDRQKDALERQIRDIKAAEEAALDPIQARQKEIEKVIAGLQAERDKHAEIKLDIEEQLGALQKRTAEIQAANKELEVAVARSREVGTDTSGPDGLTTSVKNLNIALTDLMKPLGTLKDSLSPGLQTSVQLLGGAIDVTTRFAADLRTELEKRGAFDAMLKLWDELKTAAEAVGKILSDTFTPAVKGLQEWAGKLNTELGLWEKAVNLVAGAITQKLNEYQAFFNLVKGLAEVAAAVVLELGKLKTLIPDVVESLLPPQLKAAVELWERLANAIRGARGGGGGGTTGVPTPGGTQAISNAGMNTGTMTPWAGGYGGGSNPGASAEEIANYITAASLRRGIDPNIAHRVVQSEGGYLPNAQSNAMYKGRREESFGPFQLFIEGGEGNTFMQRSGLDPRDPSTWQEQIDFALERAAQGGWGPWNGAKRAGIGPWEGISSGRGFQSNLMLDDMEKMLAESFKLRPEIFDSMTEQVKSFGELMTQDLDTGPAVDAFARLAAAMPPVENAVANTTMPLHDLEALLVEMAARAGFSNEPLNEMRAGLIGSATALQEVVRGMASADPRFQTLLDQLDATGGSTQQFALDVLQLLNGWGKVPAAAQAVAGAVGAPLESIESIMARLGQVAPGVQTAVAGVTAAAGTTNTAVDTVGSTTVNQAGEMIGQWEAVGRAVDESRDQLRRYTDYLFELTPERLREQSGGWREVAEQVHEATQRLEDYRAELERLPGGAGALEGRAAGGPVRAGTPYLVGEAGPEVFVPSATGTIEPNMGGGAVFNFYGYSARDESVIRAAVERTLRDHGEERRRGRR